MSKGYNKNLLMRNVPSVRRSQVRYALNALFPKLLIFFAGLTTFSLGGVAEHSFGGAKLPLAQIWRRHCLCLCSLTAMSLRMTTHTAA